MGIGRYGQQSRAQWLPLFKQVAYVYSFFQYDEVSSAAQKLATVYPETVKVEKLGTSVRSRELFALLVTDQKGATNRPAVLMTATTHGDEPLSLSTILYFIRTVLRDRDSEPVKRLLEKTRLYFVPIINPDAWVSGVRGEGPYEKNSRDTCSKDPSKSGVNLGHNYNFQFDTYLPANSNRQSQYEDPCSPEYHGPEPFSEPETAAIRDLVGRINPKVTVFIHQRSGDTSSLVIPYTYHPANATYQSSAFKLMHSSDASEYKAITEGMSSASSDVKYMVGSSYEVSKHTISGSEVDWAFDQANSFAVMMQVANGDRGAWPSRGHIEDLVKVHTKPLLQLTITAETLKPKTGRPGKSITKHVQTAFYIVPMILGVVLAFILMIGYVVARALGYDKIWDR
ncbi:hypothetical protein HK097_011496, partial [Rhizophlyctis rosea]